VVREKGRDQRTESERGRGPRTIYVRLRMSTRRRRDKVERWYCKSSLFNGIKIAVEYNLFNGIMAIDLVP